MSQQRKRVFFSALIVVTVAAMAVFLFVRHPRAASPEDSKPDVAAPARNEAATMQSQGSPRYRNLSLQPEAFKLSRRLGRRFGASPEVSVIAGTLQIGSQREVVQITRRQSARGDSGPDGIQRIKDTNGNSIRIFCDGNGMHYLDEHTSREIRITCDPAGNGGQGQGQV